MIMAGTRENFYDQLKQPLSEDSGIIQILLPFEISYYLKVQKTPRQISLSGFQKQGYKDSNLEMTESESVALPFGDSPSYSTNVIIRYTAQKSKYFFYFFQFFSDGVTSLFHISFEFLL